MTNVIGLYNTYKYIKIIKQPCWVYHIFCIPLSSFIVLSLITKSAEQTYFFTRFNRCYYETGNVSSIFHALIIILSTLRIENNYVFLLKLHHCSVHSCGYDSTSNRSTYKENYCKDITAPDIEWKIDYIGLQGKLTFAALK